MAMSNKNVRNTNSNFLNKPYGGIHFYGSKPVTPGMGGIDNKNGALKYYQLHYPVTSKDLTHWGKVYGLSV